MFQPNSFQYKEHPGIRNVSTREKFTVITDTTSVPGVTYEGRCQLPLIEALQSLDKAVWQLWRNGVKSVVVDTVTYTSGVHNIQGISERSFQEVWDDRISIFQDGALASESLLSVTFDGVDEFLDGGDIHQFDIATAWSVGMWINPNNLSAQRALLSKCQTGGSILGQFMYHLATSGRTRLQARTASTLRLFDFSLGLTAMTWNHFVITYTGNSNMNGYRVYLDSVVDAVPTSNSLVGTILFGDDWVVGARSSAGSFPFSGLMDNITVWDKALSQVEVSELYNGGDIINPVTHSAQANLKSFYPVGDGDTSPTVSDNKGSDDLTMTNMDSSNFSTDTP